MNLSNLFKSLISISGTLGLVTISNLLFINSANAFDVTFSNGGFDEPLPNGSLDDWSSIGDVTFNGGIDGVNPLSNPGQAILTTGYLNGVDDRNDDFGLDFNQSGTNPVDADTLTSNNTGQDLQTFLGLDTDALSIDRSNGLPGYRTPKEGSGLYQDIMVAITAADVANGNNAFEISFNWAYLSNDGTSPDFGNQDYGFVSIYDTNSTPSSINVLAESDQTITAPTMADDYNNANSANYNTGSPNLYTQSFSGLAAGNYTYRVGFGVVDVDSYDRTSALLVDDFSVEQVPFEFSPSGGIAIILTLIGFNHIKRRVKHQ